MSNSSEHFAVIMAGGVGTRFWPMSRTSKPKQFLDILGTGRSLIQMTFDRLSSVVPPSNIVVVTNELYRSDVASHLPSLPSLNILCEPCMRNTAPCIAYANEVIANRVASTGMNIKDVGVIVAPSDHLILNQTEFNRIISLALDEACATSSLVTLGIKPTRPDTGYGYIKFSSVDSIADSGSGSGSNEIASVERFTEKPDLETAQGFLSEGGYCWNSGIFVWSLENITSEFSKHLPDMLSSFKGASLCGDAGEVDEIYASCDSISIDYGILERAAYVSVIPCDFGWSDLGTWTSLAGHLDCDTQGNGASGSRIVASESSGNVVVGDSEKLVALRGLNNFIVVDTPDALLICPKSDEQWVKTLVGDLKKKGKAGLV